MQKKNKSFIFKFEFEKAMLIKLVNGINTSKLFLIEKI